MLALLTYILSFGLLFAEPAAMAWAYHWFVYPETHFALSYWAFFGLNFIAFVFIEYLPASDLHMALNMDKEERSSFAILRMATKWFMFLTAWGVFFIVHLIIH